jgi:hypothetical protein
MRSGAKRGDGGPYGGSCGSWRGGAKECETTRHGWGSRRGWRMELEHGMCEGRLISGAILLGPAALPLDGSVVCSSVLIDRSAGFRQGKERHVDGLSWLHSWKGCVASVRQGTVLRHLCSSPCRREPAVMAESTKRGGRWANALQSLCSDWYGADGGRGAARGLARRCIPTPREHRRRGFGWWRGARHTR